MSALQSLADHLSRAVGLRVVKRRATALWPPYRLEWYLQSLFERLGVNVVLDVGAHHGEYGALLRGHRVRYRGRIVSFEPVGGDFERLRARADGDAEWRCVHAALGAEPGDAAMSVSANSVFSSLLPLSSYASAEFGRDVARVRVETVSVRRLDEVFDACVAGVASPRVYLKMDTQGYDPQVLDGARGVLSHVVALQSEMPVAHVYEGTPGMSAQIERLQALGFQPTAFFPVTPQRDGVHVVEFDCVAVRSPLPSR